MLRRSQVPRIDIYGCHSGYAYAGAVTFTVTVNVTAYDYAAVLNVDKSYIHHLQQERQLTNGYAKPSTSNTNSISKSPN